MSYAHREQVRQTLEGRERPLEATASIDAEACLPFCSVCVEHCPVPGALTLVAGRVMVSRVACNGCAACVPVCPSPASPIRLVPRREGTRRDSGSGSEDHKRDNARDGGGLFVDRALRR
jgi:ferredoxin